MSGPIGKNAKAFPLHTDTFGFYPDPQAPTNAIKRVYESGIQAAMETLGERPYGPGRRPRFFHYLQNSFNDPICIYYVLDLLTRWQRGAYIRPHYIVPTLRTEQPHIHWTVGTVGRILGALASVASDCYFGLGSAFVDDVKHVPFARGRDARGHYYVIDPQGGDEGLLWLVRARDIFQGEAEATMLNEERGIFEDSYGSEIRAADYVASKLDYTVRTKEGFLAQLRPDEQFHMAPPPVKRSEDPFAAAVTGGAGG